MIRPSTAIGLALLGLLAAPQPQAQSRGDGVAQLKDVHGNVLVSRESGLSTGAEALRLGKGTRVITTANAEVVVHYDDGCEVRLKENQRFEVDTDKPCAFLIAQVQPILVDGASLAIGPALGVFGLGPGLGGAAIGVELIRGGRHNPPASPS
jgi:hypothetical protein